MKRYVIVTIIVSLLIATAWLGLQKKDLFRQPHQATKQNAAFQEPFLTDEELTQLTKKDLQPFLSDKELDLLAPVAHLLFISSAVLVSGEKFISDKYPENTPEAKSAKEKELAAFHQVLDSIRQRYKENMRLKEETINWWKETLPMHRKNLSYSGPKGQIPSNAERISKPRDISGFPKYTVCEKISYSDGTFSLFFFDQEILTAREDYASNGKILTRYYFFAPEDYSLRNSDKGKYTAQGAVKYMALFDDQTPPLPWTEKNYGETGLLVSELKRTFSSQIQEKTFYGMSDGVFALFLKTPIHNPEEEEIPLIERIFIFESYKTDEKDPFPSKGSYRRTLASGQTVGTWTADEHGSITLDNGTVFPSARLFAHAPLYREEYPVQAAYPTGAAQKAPELL